MLAAPGLAVLACLAAAAPQAAPKKAAGYVAEAKPWEHERSDLPPDPRFRLREETGRCRGPNFSAPRQASSERGCSKSDRRNSAHHSHWTAPSFAGADAGRSPIFFSFEKGTDFAPLAGLKAKVASALAPVFQS